MFYKYNAVLRKFSPKAYRSCKIWNPTCPCCKSGNLVTSAISDTSNCDDDRMLIDEAAENDKNDEQCTCSYNTYPTTINAILSGLRKLMWVAPLPKDRFVYRGLSGKNLPDQFFKQDEYGVRGGTEYGMMSTTVKF